MVSLDYNTIKQLCQKFGLCTSCDITNNRYGNIHFLEIDKIVTIEINQWIESNKIEMVLFNTEKWNDFKEHSTQAEIIRNVFYIFW